MQKFGMANVYEISPTLYSTGRPTLDVLEQMKAEGVGTIVNFCHPTESAFDEGAAVRELGMDYEELVVSGPEDVSAENAARLRDILDRHAGGTIVMHCGSGNRVGALYAMKAFHCDGASSEDALAQGRCAGLLGLEAYVRGCCR